AIIKITARTVLGQEPRKTLECIERHLKAHTPQGLSLEISERETTGGAIQLSVKSPNVQRATRALSKIFDVPVSFLWLGASVPIVATLSEVSGADPVLVGF